MKFHNCESGPQNPKAPPRKSGHPPTLGMRIGNGNQAIRKGSPIRGPEPLQAAPGRASNRQDGWENAKYYAAATL
jgi:hypothetical protein